VIKTPSYDPGASTDVLLLSPQQAEAIVRVVEAAPHVRRRHQFFVWTQSQLQALLPHEFLACAAYERRQRDLVFEAFQNVVLAPEAVALLTHAEGPLLRALVAAWVGGRGRAQLLEPARMGGALHGEAGVLRSCGIETLLVHGVSRPERPVELESFFVFASRGRTAGAQSLAHLELLLPHLHNIWQRVMAAEREMTPTAALPKALRRGANSDSPKGVTLRERQILLCVREGKSNLQIGEVLNISPLTVKNHVQKILRKLGASNRAQAVAEAIAMGLLDGRQT
jgi:transcriptional regulator EpsA